MATLLAKIQDTYNFIFYDLCDDRTRDLFPTHIHMLIILPTYLYFVKRLGPRIMQNLQPFELKTPIMLYNIFQICISFYIFVLGLAAGWLNHYDITCQPVDYTENIYSRRMLNGFWWYTTVKLIDLMDTIFFVLRKKDRQISFLHVFHHFMMPIASYIGLKYFPNGHSSLLGIINSFVHVIMYTYYLIAGLGPKYQKYIWWKQHVTTLQLVQFAIIFVHNVIPIFKECAYPKWINVLLAIHSLQFVYLFGSFYYETYIKTPQKKTKSSTANGTSKKVKAN
ncbi:elongation of very long chain fatty acids protein AAEL008004-like [Trichoplusia ni]|uniref:Elongation of very long chain fatty acids protein n=1 Tax=Trichoplusia ni TaxID=7111 RepID=A0A7E5VNQ0_TRINI|nr:elongation of very long chain fatty acids protein AAEL008004-like [Trichoplusia ni]